MSLQPPQRPRLVRLVSSKTELHPDVSHALGLFVRTPLIFSPPLSEASHCNVFLKMDAMQPSGSFKSRGVGHLCHLASLDHLGKTHLVVSSGGNAALAVAHAARMLRLKATTCVHPGTPESVQERLRRRGVEVRVAEEVGWEHADRLAREIVAEDPFAVYIPPFDHKAVVEGHTSMITELIAQWPVNFRRADVQPRKPDAIICSVGGGGLLAGVLAGLKLVRWQDVPVLACESEKTSSLLASLTHAHTNSSRDLSSLDRIGANTICASLGARTVSQTCLDCCLDHPGGVTELVCPEWKAAQVCQSFLADHHLLIEPACAVALSAFYPPSPLDGMSEEEERRHRRKVIDEAIPSLRGKEKPNIVVVVCGGSFGTIESLLEWEKRFAEGTEERAVPFQVYSEGQLKEMSW